jgi:hypothetical protein
MALTFRVTGRRRDGDREIVDGEWTDSSDPARALRSGLVSEAEDLERRAAELRRQATVVPDSCVVTPDDRGNFTSDEAVSIDMQSKADAIARNLGL